MFFDDDDEPDYNILWRARIFTFSHYPDYEDRIQFEIAEGTSPTTSARVSDGLGIVTLNAAEVGDLALLAAYGKYEPVGLIGYSVALRRIQTAAQSLGLNDVAEKLNLERLRLGLKIFPDHEEEDNILSLGEWRAFKDSTSYNISCFVSCFVAFHEAAHLMLELGDKKLVAERDTIREMLGYQHRVLFHGHVEDQEDISLQLASEVMCDVVPCRGMIELAGLSGMPVSNAFDAFFVAHTLLILQHMISRILEDFVRLADPDTRYSIYWRNSVGAIRMEYVAKYMYENREADAETLVSGADSRFWREYLSADWREIWSDGRIFFDAVSTDVPEDFSDRRRFLQSLEGFYGVLVGLRSGPAFARSILRV